MEIPIAIRVPSASVPNRQYLVRYIDGRWECQCAGFSYRGRCRHASEVQEAYERLQARSTYDEWAYA